MFWKKKRSNDMELYDERNGLKDALLENLVSLCEDGVVYEDAFVLEDDEVYVYADIIAVQNHVVQVVFQLHHEWMQEPYMEVIAAAGDSDLDAVYHVCNQFYQQILSIYIKALQDQEDLEMVEGITQTSHYFYVCTSEITCIGKREGFVDEDFWKMLKFDVIQRLGNQKVYWMKCFASKQGNKVECEVHMNGREAKSLSNKLKAYASNWDCLDSFYSEKQWILFIQDDRSYEQSMFHKEDIVKCTKEAIRIFEESKPGVSLKEIRQEIFELCEDESLTYELLSFVPELYCEYVYPQVEFGEKLFLVQKNRKTKELYQSQLQSFGYIADTVRKHLASDDVEDDVIQQVISYSMNAKAIERAIEENTSLDEITVSGIGYLGSENYVLR